MGRLRVSGRSVSAVALLAVLFGAAPSNGAQNAASEPAAQSPAADRQPEQTVQRVCGTCHEWKRATDTRRSKTQWEIVIDDMTNRGAKASDQEFDEIFAYLLRHHGSVNVNEAPAEELEAVLGLETPEAEAVVNHRSKVGKFADLDALKQVGGVDPKKLDAGRASITY